MQAERRTPGGPNPVAPARGERAARVQVVAILEAGHPLPFRIKAANLDLPELQGEPEAIALEKCRLAAQQAHARAWGRA